MPYMEINSLFAQAAPPISFGEPRLSYGKTLEIMTRELHQLLGNREDVEEHLTGYINDAYLDICSSLDMPELDASYSFETTGGSAYYNMPTGIDYTRSAAIIDPSGYALYKGRPLKKIDLQAYRMLADVVDEPTTYFRFNNILVLHPTPVTTRVVSVDVRVAPQPLSAVNHSPILSMKWHEAIVKLARAKGFDAVLEFEKAAIAENSYTALVRRKLDEKAEEDVGRLVGSSVPRKRSDLVRNRLRR